VVNDGQGPAARGISLELPVEHLFDQASVGVWQLLQDRVQRSFLA
jgi:hypothetical protein